MPDPTQCDLFADEYLEHADTAPYNALYDRPAMLDLLGCVQGKRVLDVGCDPGLYLIELIKKGAEVIGCDASPSMIELAKERFGNTAEEHLRPSIGVRPVVGGVGTVSQNP